MSKQQRKRQLNRPRPVDMPDSESHVEETKGSAWKRMENLVRPAAYLLGLLGTGFISGFFFCRAVDQYFGFTRIASDKLLSIERTAERAETWEFSEPLYKQLPGDFDFIARHLWVSNLNGHSAVLVGPSEGDEIHVSIGSWAKTQRTGTYTIPFTLNGKVAGEEFRTRLGTVTADRHVLSDPVTVHGWQIYLYVEDVKPDQILMSIVRRKSSKFNVIQRDFRPHNQAVVINERKSPPILRRKDEPAISDDNQPDEQIIAIQYPGDPNYVPQSSQSK